MTEGSWDGVALELRDVGAGHVADLQGVFERAGDYFLRITGRPEPAPDAAEREARSAASTPGRGVALVVRTAAAGEAKAATRPEAPAAASGADAPSGAGAPSREAAPIGAIGWWAGHPEPDLALLGMLMIVQEARGRGHAREALARLEDRLRAEGITRLRTAVGAEDAGSRAFVEALGFASTEERTRVDTDSGRLRIAFFEKAL